MTGVFVRRGYLDIQPETRDGQAQRRDHVRRVRREGSCLHTKEQVLRETNPADTLSLDFQPSELEK